MNCVLALKSHAEGKLGGRSGSGSLKYGQKPPTSAKPMVRKNSEPFMKSLWSMAAVDKDGYTSDNSSYSDLGHDRPEGVRDSFIFIIFFFFCQNGKNHMSKLHELVVLAGFIFFLKLTSSPIFV